MGRGPGPDAAGPVRSASPPARFGDFAGGRVSPRLAAPKARGGPSPRRPHWPSAWSTLRRFEPRLRRSGAVSVLSRSRDGNQQEPGSRRRDRALRRHSRRAGRRLLLHRRPPVRRRRQQPRVRLSLRRRTEDVLSDPSSSRSGASRGASSWSFRRARRRRLSGGSPGIPRECSPRAVGRRSTSIGRPERPRRRPERDGSRASASHPGAPGRRRPRRALEFGG